MSDIVTRDENGELAMRTVVVSEGGAKSDYDDLYTRTSDGKRALRVVSSGDGSNTGLPAQEGHTGFLQTNGTEASWSDKEPLVNNSTGLFSLGIGRSSFFLGSGATSIGQDAKAQGTHGVALGALASAASENGISIGYNANVLAKDAIQIGTGTNSVPGTLSIGLSGNNYRLLNADGTIPIQCLAISPSAAGTYVLKATVADDGTITTAWVAE